VDVPSPAQFDHVITAARLGSGTALTWLDTTPEVTPFGLILYQLRNKQAVLASEDSEGGLQRTPADSPIKTFMHFTLDGKFTELAPSMPRLRSLPREIATGRCAPAFAAIRRPSGRIL